MVKIVFRNYCRHRENLHKHRLVNVLWRGANKYLYDGVLRKLECFVKFQGEFKCLHYKMKVLFEFLMGASFLVHFSFAFYPE